MCFSGPHVLVGVDELSALDVAEQVVDDSAVIADLPQGPVRWQLRDQVGLNVREIEEVEEHNRGSAVNPMSIAQIEGKFLENVEGTLSPQAARRVIDLALSLDAQADATAITRATVPGHD